jgi:hypothetical protein
MSDISPSARRWIAAAHARAAATRILRRCAALSRGSSDHPDGALLAACAAYGHAQRRADRLARADARSTADHTLEQAQAALHEAASSALADIVTHRATTPEGHCARAAAILAWDQGELISLVARYGILQDRLMLALLADLIGPLRP